MHIVGILCFVLVLRKHVHGNFQQRDRRGCMLDEVLGGGNQLIHGCILAGDGLFDTSSIMSKEMGKEESRFSTLESVSASFRLPPLILVVPSVIRKSSPLNSHPVEGQSH